VCGHHGHKTKRASTLPEEDRRPQSRSVAPIVPDFTHYDRVTFPPRQDPASLIFPPLRRLHPPPADSSRRPPGTPTPGRRSTPRPAPTPPPSAPPPRVPPPEPPSR